MCAAHYIGLEELVPTFEAAFLDQGWPENAKNFSKDACLSEVQRRVEEAFPGEVSFPEQ